MSRTMRRDNCVRLKTLPFQSTLRYIVDGGSLEHIFDAATAFRISSTCAKSAGESCSLPVNNLNGHGFWQFSSDLIHSLYCGRNGFSDTKVYYASNIDPRTWYEMPVAKPGVRVELCRSANHFASVTRKIVDVAEIEVSQPFTLLRGRRATYRSQRTGRGCQTHSGRASPPSCRATPNWRKLCGTYPFFMVWPLVMADMRLPADANEKSSLAWP